LVLSLGPRAPDDRLRHWLTLVQPSGEEPLPLPGPDALNAWRLASLFALLPRVFTGRASFSINEVAAVPGFAVVIQRDGPPTTLPLVPVHPFVDRCLDWVENDRLEDLEALVVWLSGVMVAPSVAALADLAAFYEDVVIPLCDAAPLDWPNVGERWRALPPHAPLRCEALKDAARSCLAAAPAQHQVAIVLAVCRLMASSGGSVDDEIVEAASRVLGSELPFAARLSLQTELPLVVQERLWQRAQPRRSPFMPLRSGGEAKAEEALWLLVALAVRVYERHPIDGVARLPAWVFQTLEDAAERRAAPGLAASVEYLVSLAGSPIALGKLRPQLVEHAHRQILRGSSPSGRIGLIAAPDPSDLENDIVTAFLDRTIREPAFSLLHVDRALDVVLDFVRASSDRPFGDLRLAARVLLAWLPRALVGRSRQSIDRVVEATRLDGARLVGAAYRELLGIRCDPETAFLAIPLREHRRWVAWRRGQRGWRARLPGRASPVAMERFGQESVARFYENVRRAVRELDPALGLALGVEYAADVPGALIGPLVELLRAERDRVSDAWRRGEVRFCGRYVRMADVLARLLVCADGGPSPQLSEAARSIAGLPSYSTPAQYEELARELSHHHVSLKRIEQAAGLRRTGFGWMGGR
jgi:hypothetical protein